MATILLVDDDEIWCHMLVRRLKREGFSADYMLSGEQALEHIAQTHIPYEILLIDHRLGPGMDGIELLRQVHDISPNSDAILFTALDEPGVGLQAYKAGAYRYLHKPFEPQELILIIQSLLEWRKSNYEREWLGILNQIVEQLQGANTVHQVGQILVDGGVKLGFDRARFYSVRLVNGELTLYGVCQSGINLARGFERLVYPLAKTRYCQTAFKRKQATFFKDLELGRSLLSDFTHSEGLPKSLGEWVSIPLVSGDECLGFLNMDNCSKAQAIHPIQKDLLRLFVGQAVSALARALRYEREQQDRQVDQIVRRILQRMGDPAQSGSLDRLLHAIRNELTVYVPVPNFLVVLNSRDTDGFYTRLHIENDKELRKPYWRSNSEKDMIWCMLTYGHPLFLPQGTQEHREKYGLQQVGKRPARSWMAAPLRIGALVIGALIAEDDDHENRFQVGHFELLQALADRLAGVIQAAWLNEQEQEYSKLLRRLQQASELIVGFSEEQLWLATLTLCTADYGASFDRAMLFLADEGGARLTGRMAIGHLAWEDAKFDWEADVRKGMDWGKFLVALQVGSLKPTPLYGAVRDYSFTVGDDAFAQVLQEKDVMILSKEEAQARLPANFLARFGITGYCLMPVKAADQIIGVVVLDNIWGKNPRRVGVLDILDNLTNQAALRYENLRKARAQEQLIAVQHEVLVQAVNRPLQETLQRICESIQSITGADLVAIYPLQDNGDELLYDHNHSARLGRRNLSISQPSYAPTGLSKHVLLEAKQPVLIPDVTKDKTLYCGEWHGNAPIVRDEGIRATIVAPVFGLRASKPRAMLYIDFRNPHHFTEHDRQIAEAFAHLIATAISNWREAKGLRDTQEAREEELHRLDQVLEGALVAESDERQIAQLLLNAVSALFAPLPVTTGITLKEWRRATPDAEPTEMHRFIYSVESKLEERLIQAEENAGINGRAMRTGQLQNAPDVNLDLDYSPRDNTTCSELDIPILVDGQVVGALNIESPQLAAFTKHHEEMAQRFAHVAALAIGNVRRQRNLRTVLVAARAITALSNLPTTLQKIADGVRQAVPNLSTLTIWYKDPQSGHLALADSYFGVRNEAALLANRPRQDGMERYAMTFSSPLWVENVDREPRFAEKDFVKNEGIRSTAVFPLWAQKEAVGVMFFSYREAHTFTNEEKRLYPILAEVAAASIQNALLLTQARRERQRFALALDVTSTIGAELDQEKVIKKLLSRLQQDDLFPNTTAAVLRYDKEEKHLVFTPSSLPFYFPEDPEHPIVSSVPVDGKSIVAAMARKSFESRQEESINEGNVQNNPDYMNVRPDTQSKLAVSLWSEEKGLIGVLVLESTQRDAFSQDAEQTAYLLARQMRLAIERLRQQRENLDYMSALLAEGARFAEIAHDISQAVFEIRGWVDALMSDTVVTEGVRKDYALRIDKAALQLMGSTAMERQQPECIVLDEKLRMLLERIVSKQGSDIRLEYDLHCGGVHVKTYPYALERVLRHLVRNSIQAVQKSQHTNGCIQLATRMRGGDGVEIVFRDNGPGIPSELKVEIFHKKIQSSSTGSGIGLLLAQYYVKQIDGTIHVADNGDEPGAQFNIQLPLQPLRHEKEMG